MTTYHTLLFGSVWLGLLLLALIWKADNGLSLAIKFSLWVLSILMAVETLRFAGIL